MIQILAAVGSEESVLVFPPIVFGAITFAVFTFLGFVVWSFRDVANRHSNPTAGQAGHGHAGTTTEHD